MIELSKHLRVCRWKAGLLAVLLIAAIFKVILVLSNRLPFNSDEAVVALMARHILQGERPVFFYGQAYMGSLDAWLVAGAFQVFGQQVWVIRLVQSGLYLAVLASTALLGRVLAGFWTPGVLAAWLLALPSVNTSLYTTISLGGYGEALLLGNLLLLAALYSGRRMTATSSSPLWIWVGMGMAMGVSLWGFGLTLVFSLPAVFYMAWAGWCSQRFHRTGWLLLAAGVLIGSVPWWLAWLNNDAAVIAELSGSAIAGGQPWLPAFFAHLLNFLLFGITLIFGIRAPWEGAIQLIWAAPILVIFWILALAYLPRLWRSEQIRHADSLMLAGVVLFTMLGFLVTPFGGDPSGRYFLPMLAPLTLLGGLFLASLWQRNKTVAILALLCVLGANLAHNLDAIFTWPPGMTTQFYGPAQVDHTALPELMKFLEREELDRGYTTYWISYPLAFLSKERLIFVPRLPYHPDLRYTIRDDRYPTYTELVARAKRIAYITHTQPELEARLRAYFYRENLIWEEEQIGVYRVFYNFDRTVPPPDFTAGLLGVEGAQG